ncbi:cytochrome [Bradyrhizobium septentrionale]|uniref:Cytochrome n=1 Tax=Bradyrhizobium septentrionale TaxID=1404411 RepID=A0ABZ2P559_9BRAD
MRNARARRGNFAECTLNYFKNIKAAWTLKYFDKITTAQARHKDDDASAEGAFDFNDLGPGGFFSALGRWFWLWTLRVVFAFFRVCWPIPKFGRLFIVTRDKDVRDVLCKPLSFGVPYGPEMRELGGGESIFVLGLEGDAQKKQHELIRGLIHDDDKKWLIQRSREIADTLLEASEGRIDVMKDLITRVASETCLEYFGLSVDDPDAFAEWAMAISALLFADPFGKPETRRLGVAGAARVRSVIDAALIRAKANRLSGNPPQPVKGLGTTILDRLVDTRTPDDEIHAIMVGMITGFIPTTTLAAGNIVEELLRTRDGLKKAIEAAKGARDDEAARKRLESLLFEAARLNPALNPGQWRHACQEDTVGTGWRARPIPKGSVLMVATASAMRDCDPPSYELVFGTGVHACLGRALAMAQITEIFAALFAREEVRVSRRKKGSIFRASIFRVGVFPRRLDMLFKPLSGRRAQDMVTVLAPLAADADVKAWRKKVVELGDPVTEHGDPDKPPLSELQTALMETGVIHFASLNVIDLGEPDAPAPYLLLELNGDGDEESLIEAVARRAEATLLPLFGSAAMGDRIPGSVREGKSLGKLLRASALDLRARPWGTTGLRFYGLPGQSAASIDRQTDLVNFCREAIDLFVESHAGAGSRAGIVLQFVRRLIRGDTELEAMGRHNSRIKELLDRGLEFRKDLMIPSRQEPETITWQEPPSRINAMLSSPTLYPVYWSLAVTAIIVSILCFYWFGFSLSFAWADLVMTVGRCLIALVSGCIGTAALLGVIVAAFAARLKLADKRDRPEDFEPDLTKVREITKRENSSGFAQNHFLSVSPLKPGCFRKFTLGIALWGIEVLVTQAFRPGFILNMGTIHFARWFRPPGSERLVFLSNYDGSWESYLEDFITKAHYGQSAAWSNAIGFPRTQWLIYGGAEDGDRFKRWVRRQQQATQFWFNRFPHLTAEQMRNNAVICWELAQASTDSQARAWLSYFGSMPKTDTQLETEETQAIVFRGFKRLPFMKFVGIHLPDDHKACADWLDSLGSRFVNDPLTRIPVLDPLTGTPVPNPLAVTFGDRPLSGDEEQAASCIAFTASGLSRLGLPKADLDGTVATFPTVFNLGMSSRQQILGDCGKSAPSEWRWSDADEKKAIHAVLLLYAETKGECDALLEKHYATLQKADCSVCELDTQPAPDGIDYEHFGFRDGISQPVIRGTQRFARGVQPRDIVEPGEILLGYKSNQGYYPPTPVVPREFDTKNRLGSVPVSAKSRFSAFQDLRPQVRDFGRNGSFLAIRQFEQHVDAFHDYGKLCAEKLDKTGLTDFVGGKISRDWVEAKMMGRWHDGTPLIDRPVAKTEEARVGEAEDDEQNNDIDYGVDDPQGLFCPFGAHIRRVNPRGSLVPGDDSELAITNRHRILRRGRSYQRGDEKGLLFIGLCADLERQFEFIQQSWLSAPGFAGLTNEPDPIMSVKPTGSCTRFTIPTSAGSLSLQGGENFVTVHGGGYFFLPSRSALMFLHELNQRRANKEASMV